MILYRSYLYWFGPGDYTPRFASEDYVSWTPSWRGCGAPEPLAEVTLETKEQARLIVDRVIDLKEEI